MNIEDYKSALQFAVSGLRDHGLTTHELIMLINPATEEATGPKIPYIAPDKSKGRWRRRADMSEVFVPGQAWKMRVDEPAPEREPSVPEIKITSVPNKGSHIGSAKDGRALDLNSTGGACKVEWQDPATNDGKPDKVRMVAVTHAQSGTTRMVPWTPDLQAHLDREAAERKV